MIIELTVTRQGNSQDKDVTYHQLEEPVDNLVAWAREILADMNKDKASFEKLYVLNGVKEYHLPDPADPKVHDWQNNSFKLLDGGRAYNLVKCSKCGITGVKYDNQVHAKIDRQFKAKYYQNCAMVVKKQQEANRKKERRASCVM